MIAAWRPLAHWEKKSLSVAAKTRIGALRDARTTAARNDRTALRDHCGSDPFADLGFP
jgi:hypothetical protein